MNAVKQNLGTILKLTLGVGTLVFLALLFTLLIGSRKPSHKSVSQQTGSDQPMPASSSPTPSLNQTDLTAGWKEYKNTKQGYVMKYPAGWYLYPYGDYVGTASVISSFDLSKRDLTPGEMPVFPGELVVSIGLETDSKPSDQKLQEWLATKKSSIAPLREPKTISSVAETLSIRLVTENVFNPEFSNVTIFIPKDNKIFFIRAVPADSPYNDTFELMLSTFQFIK